MGIPLERLHTKVQGPLTTRDVRLNLLLLVLFTKTIERRRLECQLLDMYICCLFSM
jgi:hypothetical protein